MFCSVLPNAPLSFEEMQEVSQALQRHAFFDRGSVVESIDVVWQDKDRMGKRIAHVLWMPRRKDRAIKASYDFEQHAFIETQQHRSAQVALTDVDFTDIDRLLRRYAPLKRALAVRGLEMSQIYIDGWGLGLIRHAQSNNHRLARALFFLQGENTNAYARPIEGLVALIDLSSQRVLELRDTGAVPLGQAGDFVGSSQETILPPNPGIRVHDHTIEWKRFRMQYGMHPREGLVLSNIEVRDGQQWRRVLSRASLSEMVVPYGDPSDAWAWRAAFDVGEYGMGRLATPLIRGRDVPSDAHMGDAIFAGADGSARRVNNVVAIFERDGGSVWRHYNTDTQQVYAQRGKELRIGWFTVVGNYDYGFFWVFREDGSIELDTQLTGMMLAKGVDSIACESCPAIDSNINPSYVGGIADRYGHVVGEHIVAPNHQHFFTMRLDFDIDGVKNSLLEMNTSSVAEAADNPFGNAFIMRESLLHTEQEAVRDLDMQAARKWKICQRDRPTALGHYPGYMLIAGENAFRYAQPGSSLAEHAFMTSHAFFATRYHADELYAAGEFPNQGKSGEGLAQFMANNEPIEGEDMVVWYTYGVTHIPRTEDWPVMPVHHTGFKLLPSSFFMRNPTLD